MNDDILTRLREHITDTSDTWDITRLVWDLDDAADEIERLRSAINKIEQAIVNEGKVPAHHRKIMKRHIKEWPTLHIAIGEAIGEIHD
jgi:hypothetical protein